MGKCSDSDLTLSLWEDYRLGGRRAYQLIRGDDNQMQIPDEIRKCVVFICYKDNQGIKLAGTGFILGVSLGEYGLFSTYVLTAKHVLEAIEVRSIDKQAHLRINLKDGGFTLVGMPLNYWRFHPQDLNVDDLHPVSRPFCQQVFE